MNNTDFAIKRVAVIGLGYVGLPLAMLCVQNGFDVVGIDLDPAKLASLKAGKSYLTDVTDHTIQTLMRSGRFTCTPQFNEVQNVDVCVLCVPTPLRDHTFPDLSFLQSAAKSVLPYLKQGHLIVLESSTFPGTTEEVLLPLFEQKHLKAGVDFYLGYSPERIDPGNRAYRLEEIPKVISGVTKMCREKMKQFYGQLFQETVLVSNPRVAEMTKLLENSQRLINISLMNEMAIICHELQIDLWEVIDAAKTKPFGFSAYYPGPGIGGHCIPVDPLYLEWKAEKYGLDSQFIKLAKRINDNMPSYIVERIETLVNQDRKSDLLLVGITYKKDVNDIRESTPMMVLEQLLRRTYKVRYHDPYVPDIQVLGQRLTSVELRPDTIQQADCVVILTDHTDLPYDLLLRHAACIFDTRNHFKQNDARVTRL